MLKQDRFFEILLMKQHENEHKIERFNELMEQKIKVEEEVKIFEAKVFEKDLSEMENRLKELIAKKSEVETKILSSDQLIKERESRISEYEKELEQMLKERDEIKRLDVLIRDFKTFEKALGLTQTELRSEFVEAVNYTMNSLWATLYPYQDLAGIRLFAEEGDYILQLKESSGRWSNVEGIASGGERGIACLALRISFALVLAPHLQLLVLDEPTANLDRNAISVMSKTLREKINEFIDQVFIITHEEELEEAVTGNAYRLERDKSKDEATRIISLV